MSAPEPAPGVPQRSAHGRVPDFFIVGHAKSGTTALLHDAAPPSADLHARPQGAVVLRRGAARTHAAAPRRDAADARAVPRVVRGRDGRAARRRGLAAVPVVAHGRARIAEVRPDAQIIAILREPASFLRSLHLQFVQTYVETEPDFAKALALEPAQARGARDPAPHVLAADAALLRARALRRAAASLRAVFPREQLLVLIYDDFRADNEATVRAGAALPRGRRHACRSSRCKANPTVRARSQRITRAAARGLGRARPALADASRRRSRRSCRSGCVAARVGAMRARVLYARSRAAGRRS